MSDRSGFFKGEKKKKRKDTLEDQAIHMPRVYIPPRVEIIGKNKKGK
ncbi:MAG: hypothetical protein NUV69_01630 [Candidatus Curtissbacteria bacterium]|nr:hypothetical protein [Candidatus Curtissbacteria bacterium]